MNPLLIFPKPDIGPRKKTRQIFPQPTTPSRARQGLRLNSSFNLLKRNFENGVLSADPAGFSPERTLVLETIGSVEKFYRAASKIQGLDFLQEILGDDIDPDDDFYYQTKEGEMDANGKLKGYTYLTMGNQAALDKLLFYWNQYTQKKKYKFPRGLGPLKGLFEHLYSIRYWDTEDRLRETGLIEDWQYRVAEGQDVLPIEIELWCRSNSMARAAAEERIRRYIRNLEGQVKQVCIIEEINYHAILASIPSSSVSDVISNNLPGVELLRCDEVMYFRPTGQCMAPKFGDESPNEEERVTVTNNDVEEIVDQPTAALLDGLPLENHEWIKDYITVDDPDDWSDSYKASDQNHGTSMASLIIRGDMGNESECIPRKLYCRPIMKPFIAGFDGTTRERIPDDVLPIDIVHRAVKRMFESEGNQPAVAPTVKVVNLSIADPNRMFDKVVSPWAKLIDYLSYKYQIIFVISAGNHLHDIELEITNKEFLELSPSEKEALVLKKIAENIHTRRLMSPAESINAITVAASHFDEIEDDEFYNQINPYTTRTLPSTVNPISWGKKRSIKPEILMPGGRATYRLKSFLDNDSAVMQLITFSNPPGQIVASPGATGSVRGYSYTFGTSNSAALATRRLCFLNETLQDLYVSTHGKELAKECESVLLKALLCHGASQSDLIFRLEEILKDERNSSMFKSVAAKYSGYGNVDEDRIHGCIDNQATILQCGKIKQDDIHRYKFELPECLNAKSVEKRLIITLAWISPISSRSNAYRQAHLLFEPITGDKPDNYLDMQRREQDWRMVRNGTVQHEVLSGNRASAYASGTNIEISIECRGKAGAKGIEVPYGLVVTLDTPDIHLKVYDEVKAGIEAQFEVPVTGVPPIKA